MISVAFMSDNTTRRTESVDETNGDALRQSDLRVGQCVVMVELLHRLRSLRLHHDRVAAVIRLLALFM